MLRQLILLVLLVGTLIVLRASFRLNNFTPVQASTAMLRQATGSIQGRVAASDGKSLTGIPVVVLDGAPWFSTVATTTLKADGSYTLDGLLPRAYYVEFNPQESGYPGSNPAYLAEYYNDTRNIHEADPINVMANHITPNIDAVLQLGGVISGVVTSGQSGQTLPNISVDLLYSGSNFGANRSTRTDAFGRYSVGGLPDGTYIVQWNADSSGTNSLYLPEWYNHQPTKEQADPILVSPGSVVPNISTALTAGGIIRGQVTSAATGAPISYVNITLCGAVSEQCNGTSTASDPTGVYTITGLLTGDYRLLFEAGLNRSFAFPNFSYPYFAEYYNDKVALAAADLIHIEASTMVEVDVALEPSLNITGHIINVATGQKQIGFSGTNIEIFTEKGDYVRTAFMPDFSDTYAVSELPAGRYRLRTAGSDFIHLYYPQATIFEDATTLVVEARKVFTDINFSLTPLRHDGLQVATSAQLPNILLQTSEQITIPQYSLDGGVSWRFFATTPWESGRYAPQIALAPRNIITAPVRFLVAAPTTLLYPTPPHSGLFRTGDNGLTWATYSPPVEPPCSETFITFPYLANSPADPTRLYLVAACYKYEEDIVPLKETIASAQIGRSATPQRYEPYFRLYTSADAGVTWQRSTLPGRDPSPFLPLQFVLSPVTANRLYIYADVLPDNSENYHWLQSDDAGQSWLTRNFTPTALALDAADGDRLYAVFDAGKLSVFRYTGKRSIDGGTTWTAWAQQPCPTSFRQLLTLAVEGLLFVRCDQGIFRSRDQGNTWEQINPLPGQRLAPDYGNTARILWVQNGMLYTSSDQGTTWTRISSPRALWLPIIRVK